MPIELVVFDFDGTLFDTRQDIADAVNHARQRFRLPVLALTAVTGMVGDGIAALAERAFSGTSVQPPEAATEILAYYRENPDRHSRPYPGVVETLDRLPADKAIISNKPEVLVRRILENHGLESRFCFVAGADSFERRKPDPQALEYLIGSRGVRRQAVLVVGDHTPDIEMARSAGVRSVYCNYGFFGKDLSGADFTIESFPDLAELIARL